MDTISHAPDEPSLTEAMLAEDPLAQFAAWMADVVAAPPGRPGYRKHPGRD